MQNRLVTVVGLVSPWKKAWCPRLDGHRLSVYLNVEPYRVHDLKELDLLATMNEMEYCATDFLSEVTISLRADTVSNTVSSEIVETARECQDLSFFFSQRETYDGIDTKLLEILKCSDESFRITAN